MDMQTRKSSDTIEASFYGEARRGRTGRHRDVARRSPARIDVIRQIPKDDGRGRCCGQGTPGPADLQRIEASYDARGGDLLSGRAGILDDKGDDSARRSRSEHASAKDLIAQLERASADDELYDAKVTCCYDEYIKHHVKEEQEELFRAVAKRRWT
jgi:hypothetical protein